MKKTYEGYRCWAHWNVALWLFNEYPLYQMMRAKVASSKTLDRAAVRIAEELAGERTPDGARYTKTAIRQALVGWES